MMSSSPTLRVAAPLRWWAKGALVLGLGAGCTVKTIPAIVVDPGGDDSGVVENVDEEGFLLSQSHWTVVGDATGLVPAEGAGWRVERADGAALEIQAGWLVFQTVALEPCGDDGSDASGARSSFRGRAPGDALPPPHGVADHPSSAAAPLALDLVSLAPVSAEGGGFGPARVCRAGVAAFRADTSTVGRPEDGRLDDLTLLVQGRLRRTDGGDWEDWEMFTGLSAETDLPLVTSEPWDETTSSGHITLTVAPAHMLEGVDLDLHPERVALSTLTPLLTATTASLAPGDR